MAKFHGNIGYVKTVETSPGIWTDEIILRMYTGDVLKNSVRWKSEDKINDDLYFDNQLSIVTDTFAIENAYAMKFVEFMGARWRISNIMIDRPRFTITIGGLYHGG